MIKNTLLLFIVTIFCAHSFADDYTYLKGSQLIQSNQIVASSGGLIQLTSLSPMKTVITGAMTHEVKLPDTTTLLTGMTYQIINKSTQSVIVKDFSDVVLDTITTGTDKTYILFTGGIWQSSSGGSGGGGKDLVGVSPIVITQDATTATISVDLSSKEDTANKSATTTLGTSDVLFPTQNAVKTYVDTAISAIPPQKALAGSAPISVVSDATTSTITLDQSDLVHKGSEETISASKTFSAYINMGDPTVDGSYRFYKSGNSLIYEKRVSGSWLETYRVE